MENDSGSDGHAECVGRGRPVMKTLMVKNFCLYSLFLFLCAAGTPSLYAYSSGGGGGSNNNNGWNWGIEDPRNVRIIDVCLGEKCCKVCHPEQPANCGNGVIEAGEDCERNVGILPQGWRCNAACAKERIPQDCGDGIRTPNEPCDDGNGINNDACTNACTVGVCGDNIKMDTEPCDDGNTNNGDGCSAACTTEYTCGNGITESGEGCDDNNTNNNDGCSSTCQSEGVCGNTIPEAGEGCDDGNTIDGDGCDSVCQIESLCGTNALVDEGEECEPTLAGTDWCTDQCDANVPPLSCTPSASGTVIRANCTWPDPTTVIATGGPITASSPSLDVNVTEYPMSQAGTEAKFDVTWNAKPGFAPNQLPASNQTVSVSYALPGCSTYENWNESTDEQSNIGLTCGSNDYWYHQCGSANDQWVVANLNGACRCETGDQTRTACDTE